MNNQTKKQLLRLAAFMLAIGITNILFAYIFPAELLRYFPGFLLGLMLANYLVDNINSIETAYALIRRNILGFIIGVVYWIGMMVFIGRDYRLLSIIPIAQAFVVAFTLGGLIRWVSKNAQ